MMKMMLNGLSRLPLRPGWVDSNEFPFESRWLEIEGNTIHYIDEGPESGQTLLFIHPALGWSFSYRKQIAKLKTNFRCIAFDFPGFGLSKPIETYNFTLSDQATIVERFVKALDLKNVIVWANDAGGPSAILGLAPVSSRVRGLVVGGTFGWSLKDYPGVSRILKVFSSPLFRFLNRYGNLFARSFSFALGTHKPSTVEKNQIIMPFKDRNSRNRPLKLFKTFIDPKMGDALDRSIVYFREKSLLIQFGDKDPAITYKWPERWQNEIPDSQKFVIPRAKHFPFEDAPEETTNNFLEWWDTLQHRKKSGVAPAIAKVS